MTAGPLALSSTSFICALGQRALIRRTAISVSGKSMRACSVSSTKRSAPTAPSTSPATKSACLVSLERHVPRLHNNVKAVRQRHRHALLDLAIGQLYHDWSEIDALRLPILPPILFQHATAGRRGALLILSGEAVAAERDLQALEVCLRDLFGP